MADTPQVGWPAGTDFRLESCQTLGCRNRREHWYVQQIDEIVPQEHARPILNLCTPCHEARGRKLGAIH